MRIWGWPGVAIATAILVGCGNPAPTSVLPSSPAHREAALGSLTVGLPCPAFDFETLDGSKTSLEGAKGKNLIVIVSSYT